jgi:ABC-type molybdate transport system substrate-binding protein
MSKRRFFSVLGLTALVLWGAAAHADQELIVSAAASLTNAFPEIG